MWAIGLSRCCVVLVGVAGDQLVRDLVEIGAGNLRLGTDIQKRVTRAEDKCSLPTGRDRT